MQDRRKTLISISTMRPVTSALISSSITGFIVSFVAAAVAQQTAGSIVNMLEIPRSLLYDRTYTACFQFIMSCGLFAFVAIIMRKNGLLHAFTDHAALKDRMIAGFGFSLGYGVVWLIIHGILAGARE